MPRPQDHQCWCMEPKRPGYDLCDRHIFAQQMFAETETNNWDKPKPRV